MTNSLNIYESHILLAAESHISAYKRISFCTSNHRNLLQKGTSSRAPSITTSDHVQWNETNESVASCRNQCLSENLELVCCFYLCRIAIIIVFIAMKQFYYLNIFKYIFYYWQHQRNMHRIIFNIIFLFFNVCDRGFSNSMYSW